MLVVSQPPLWPFLVFHLSDWWEASTSAALGGEAPGPPKAQGGGAFSS